MATATPSTRVPLDSWMGALPLATRNTLTICDLAIPAAHNSGARCVRCVPPSVLENHVGGWFSNSRIVHAVVKPIASQIAVCQSLTITGLLDAGIRVLDFRVAIYKEKVFLSHSVICDQTLEEALGEVSAFLLRSPGEVVVVLITRDWDHRHYFDSEENWRKVQEAVAKSLGAHLARSESEALRSSIEALCAVGRRAVVIVDLPKSVQLTAGVRKSNSNLRKSWKDSTRSVEAMVEVLKEWRAQGLLLPEAGCLKFLEVALPGLPSWHAAAGNAAFRNWLGSDPLSVGVMLDFPDEETVRAIVGKNWPTETPIAFFGKPSSLRANSQAAAAADSFEVRIPRPTPGAATASTTARPPSSPSKLSNPVVAPALAAPVASPAFDPPPRTMGAAKDLCPCQDEERKLRREQDLLLQT